MPKDRKAPETEEQRLAALGDLFDYHVTLDVKDHFNAAGKLEKFALTVTKEEIIEQREAMRGLIFMSDEDATLATLKVTDIFMRAARRAADDDKELADLLPEDKFAQKDIKILEKHGLNSLSALVKAKLAS